MEENLNKEEKIISNVLKKAGFLTITHDELDIPMLKDAENIKRLDANIYNSTESMVLYKDNYAARDVVCYKKGIAPLVIFMRKVLRKFFMKWYIEPICDQQTAFNNAVYKAFTYERSVNASQLALLNDMSTQIKELKDVIDEDKKIVSELELKIKELEDKIAK